MNSEKKYNIQISVPYSQAKQFVKFYDKTTKFNKANLSSTLDSILGEWLDKEIENE